MLTHRESSTSTSTFIAVVVGLVVLGLGTYAGRLGGPFIFDDVQSIETNATLVPFEPSRALDPPRESPVAARPLVNLSFALDAALHGLSPRGFHLTNLLLHLGCVLCAFFALRRLVVASGLPGPLRARPELPALVVAALFCVHPMAAEVVLYTSQRSESLVALCYLGSLWLLALEAQTGARCWPWLLLLGVCGASSKEVFATAPFVLLACDRAFFAGSLRAALRARPAFHAAAAASLVPVLLLQHSAPRSASVRLFELDYLLAQTEIVPGYLGRALWPARAVLDYGPLWAGQSTSAWPQLALGVALVIALLGWAVFRAPRRGFALLWILAILAPSSSVLSIHTEVGAERRFYLPLVGVLSVLTLWLWARAARGLPPTAAARALLAAGACAVALLAFTTRAQTLAYRDVRAYWRAAVEARPDNARAHYNLAETLRREGAPDAAIRSLRQALALQPGYADAHVNLSGLLIARGALAEGLTHAERAASLAPSSPSVHYNLALACALAGQSERALRELERTVRLQPGHLEAHRRLAQGYLALGLPGQARAHAELLLRNDPADALAQRVLAATP